ncbi:thermonuclease family protein [Maricaulis parjimensis]|uniref:thermonuclease family protein n=1 Tax=Maricaulis parjimensis TaxID=144023 RepID=UPI00193ACF58|nr:thermonuclease family protein [Maricaulis parjimensis]
MARILAWIVWGLLVSACSQGSAPAQIEWSGPAETVSGPLSFTLTAPDGAPDSLLEVRLAELDAPDEALAQSALAAALDGRSVGLVHEADRSDRYGRIIAHVYLEGPGGGEADWLQAELVRSGAVRVLSFADNRRETGALLALEAEARAAGRGLWAGDRLAVRPTNPDVLAQDIGSVQLVEGRVIEATRLRSGRVYLNFGADYRTDFTVMIDAEHAGRFEAAGLDPLALETYRIRVRGWVEDENGPMIRVDHPERIEILED